MFAPVYPPITTPCILSPYAVDYKGYANASVYRGTGKSVKVKHHRLVYAQAHNMNLADMKYLVVMHKCDVRNCINPDHLMLGTNAQNNADMMAKGRHVTHFTEGNSDQKLGTGNTKLTAIQAAEIKASKAKHKDIAKKYGVSVGAIDDIKYGRSWKNLC